VLERRSASGREMRAVAAMSHYIVAEIKDNSLLPSTVTLNWTYEVYTDPEEARTEMLDAIAAGLSQHRIYEIRALPAPMELTPPAA
jgi:hypothetical protein